MRFILLFILCWSSWLEATDAVIVNRPNTPGDKRSAYTYEILETALKKTQDRYGSYTFQQAHVLMQRGDVAHQAIASNDRLLHEIKRGEHVNVAAVVTRTEWESEALPVRIPVEMGLMSYRIFLIRAEDQARFSRIRKLTELKSLRSGAGANWSNYRVLQRHGFTLVPFDDYEGQFRMLINGRFDYVTRGTHEAFIELNQYQSRFPQMAIERDLLLYMPLPQYFFVSPSQPRLAQRIEAGMKTMLRDGSFHEIFQRHHGAYLKPDTFCGRRIFRIDNPFLSKETPLSQHELWFNPWRAAPGRKALCPPAPAKTS